MNWNEIPQVSGKPNFNNLLSVLRRQVPERPTLFEFFLNERLPAYDIEKHALERYLDVARHLGAVDPSPSCTLLTAPKGVRCTVTS